LRNLLKSLTVFSDPPSLSKLLFRRGTEADDQTPSLKYFLRSSKYLEAGIPSKLWARPLPHRRAGNVVEILLPSVFGTVVHRLIGLKVLHDEVEVTALTARIQVL
jgi:hypothetical protein